ncbi:hypothetical protein CRENBAI_025666 [Crenichthys baileyi]|uniref:Uncharacterized protein n=1 Tax=Crenichthys baileyi TaxID=28760 RepID=A0AAV9SK12_9TELE
MVLVWSRSFQIVEGVRLCAARLGTISCSNGGDSVTDGHYMEVQIINAADPDGAFAASPECSDRSNQTIYAKLKLPEETSAEPGGPP